jgi:hypothetical protein
MNGKHEIEARLDRSLENQIKVPTLDRRFDAAVWARIESAESRATNPRELAVWDGMFAAPSRVSRWLAVSNGIGAAVAVALVIYFALKVFAVPAVTLNLEVTANLPLPQMSEAMTAQIISVLGYVLGFVTLAFGIALTSYGRRLRSSFN